jgi:hypothetical protein
VLTIVRHALPWARKRPRLADGPFGDARTKLVLRDLDRGYNLDDALARSRVSGGSTSCAYVTKNLVFSAATGAKTALNTIAPAGHGLAVVEIGVSFNGVTASDAPALVELCTSTQVGAGTSAGSTPTVIQTRGKATSGSAPTAGHNYTAEPTTLVSVRQWLISPNGGVLIYPLPLGREVECESSGGTIKALCIRVNTSATVSLYAYMKVEAIG